MRDLGITNYRGILGGALVDYFNWVTYDINGPQLANTTYSTTALTDYAIDYIHQHEAKKPNEPWFLYQAFNAPHAANGGNNPYQVPPAALHHVDLSSVGNPAPGVYQTSIPVYQADIQALDTEIGRLLAEVDFSKTLVIFVGDNGVPPPVKDTATGLRDAKGSAYEGGVRVPLIVAGAGVTRRGREDNLFVTTDLYATILDVAGVPVSHVNDSYSLKPLFTDEAASTGRTFSFSEISTGTSQRQYGLRDTRFKLVNNLGKLGAVRPRHRFARGDEPVPEPAVCGGARRPPGPDRGPEGGRAPPVTLSSRQVLEPVAKMRRAHVGAFTP